LLEYDNPEPPPSAESNQSPAPQGERNTADNEGSIDIAALLEEIAQEQAMTNFAQALMQVYQQRANEEEARREILRRIAQRRQEQEEQENLAAMVTLLRLQAYMEEKERQEIARRRRAARGFPIY
jgi:hypothetical protein